MRWPSYATYVDSGKQCGPIPGHWEALALKRITKMEYGDALAEGVRSAGDVKVYGSNGCVGQHVEANTMAPSIIVGRKGSFGKVTFSESPTFCIDTAYYIDARHSNSDLRWLYWTLQATRLDDVSQDTGVPGLSREVAYARVIPKPPLAEQQCIARFLDRETAKIDAMIAKQERLIELLQEKRQALITRAVTKGLNPSVAMKDSGVEWLGEVPVHWEIKALARLVPRDRPITYGIVLPGPNVEEGVPIIKSGDVKPERLALEYLDRTTFEIEAGYPRSRVRAGDIIFAIRGSVGAAEIAPAELEGANLTQDTARVTPDTPVHGPWLLAVLKSHATEMWIEARTVGATVKGVNLRDLRRLPVPVCPLPEQLRIAEFVRREIDAFDRLMDRASKSVDLMRERRSALISAAVTGKIDVREAV